MAHREDLRRKYFPHLFDNAPLDVGSPLPAKQQVQQEARTVNFPTPNLTIESQHQPSHVPSQRSPRDTSPPPSSYGQAHLASRRGANSSRSNSSGSSNDHSTVSSLTQRSENINTANSNTQFQPVADTSGVAITSEHQPQRCSLDQISSAHDASVKIAFTSSSSNAPQTFMVTYKDFSCESVNTDNHHKIIANQTQGVDEEEYLPFSPPKDSSSSRSPIKSPIKEISMVKSESIESSGEVVEKKQSSESLKDLLLMTSLSNVEKIVLVIFVALILVFQLTVNVEDIIAYDYKNNSIWLIRISASLMKASFKDFTQQLIQTVQSTGWKKAVTIVVAVSYLTYFFDRNTDETDRYIVEKGKEVKRGYISTKQQLAHTLTTLISVYQSIWKKWSQVPRLAQYCTIFFILSTAVKYGFLRVLMAMRPTIVRCFLLTFPYVTAIAFFVVLFQLISMWRMKAVRREVAIELVYERLKSLIQEKDEFYSMESIKKDIELDDDLDLEEYSVESLWNDVRSLIKADSQMQLNDFHLDGRKVQYLGYKPNKPRVPKFT